MSRKRQRHPLVVPISEYPFTPETYPGRRPRFSFFFTPQGIYRVSLRTLDRFLSNRGFPRVEERFAVLAYGSNASPGQLLRKYENYGLKNVPVLFGRLVGAEAVYARRTAGNGSYVPATLARKKGSRSSWITLLTAEQFGAMDASEGRPRAYELAELTRAKFFVSKRQFTPLYTYVSVRNGVMTRAGKPVSLRSARQKRANSLLDSGQTVEKAASACLDYIIIPDLAPPPQRSQIIRR